MAERYFNEMKKTKYVVPLDETGPRERVLNILSKTPDALQMLKESYKFFKPIKNSIYITRKQKQPTEDDIFECECLKSTEATPEQLSNPELSFDCKEKCINRLICTECKVDRCRSQELCHNRQFQLQQDRAIYPFNAGAKGWGLRAAEFIPKGSFIIRYVGEIYSIKTDYGISKMIKYSKNTCTYLMSLSTKEVIDPTEKGNIARFINHSCDPNCITQKWNVLGEIAVGIFALQNIEPGTELTFDYKFDVYKTPLMRCLCGTAKCKGYLGLMETDTQDENDNQNEVYPCEICGRSYENDEDNLQICEDCGNGYHTECLNEKVDESTKDNWFCPFCIQKNEEQRQKNQISANDIRQKKKAQFLELSQQVSKSFIEQFNKMEISKKIKDQEFLEYINEQNQTSNKIFTLSPIELQVFKWKAFKLISSVTRPSIFWNNSDTSYRNIFNKRIKLTVIGTQRQIDLVSEVIEILEKVYQSYKENSGNIQKRFRIPAIFLKRLLGEYYCNLKEVERLYNVRIHFNRSHVTDDCYPIHFLTTVFLQGKNQNIIKAHEHIRNQLLALVARRKYLTRSDIKIIINKLAYIKKKISPSEIRCCRDNALRDINHPFYTIYYKNKEVAFIGTQEEVKNAEQVVQVVIEQSQQFVDNTISLNYLIPVCNKNMLLDLKQNAERMFHGCKLIVYDPLHPRKNVSITLTSSYRKQSDFFNFVKEELDQRRLFPRNFFSYQTQMLYQMSKYFFKYMQNYIQTKSMVFMKSWDSITAEYDENSLQYESALKILYPEVQKDDEFRFYILRVNQLWQNSKMDKIDITKKMFLEVLKNALRKKNEHIHPLDFSVLKDPVSGKLPEDYNELSEKEFQMSMRQNYRGDHFYQQNYQNNNQYHQRSYYPPPHRNYYYQGYRKPYGFRSQRSFHDYQPKYRPHYRKPFYNYNNYERHHMTRDSQKSESRKQKLKKSKSQSSSSSLSSSSKSSKKSKDEKQSEKNRFQYRDNFRDNYKGQFNKDSTPHRFRQKEFQSSRYYKTSIDSNSENEDIYKKERQMRKRGLESSLSSIDSKSFEKNPRENYERRNSYYQNRDRSNQRTGFQYPPMQHNERFQYEPRRQRHYYNKPFYPRDDFRRDNRKYWER